MLNNIYQYLYQETTEGVPLTVKETKEAIKTEEKVYNWSKYPRDSQ